MTTNLLVGISIVVVCFGLNAVHAAERLIGAQSARVMSQSMPWIAEETGIFRKYNLEFPLVYIGTSPLATAAMLGGEAQLLIDGGVGVVRTTAGGNPDLVFIAGIKNHLTQSILAKPEFKRLKICEAKRSASPASARRPKRRLTRSGATSKSGLVGRPAPLEPSRLAFEDLPRIDVVLISHDHYDHLDLNTVKRRSAESASLAISHRP